MYVATRTASRHIGVRRYAVLADGRAAYDGRATKEENWYERTGLAVPDGRPGGFVAVGDDAVADVRYLDAVALPAGGHRLFYEAPTADGSHELCTELIRGERPVRPGAA